MRNDTNEVQKLELGRVGKPLVRYPGLEPVVERIRNKGL